MYIHIGKPQIMLTAFLIEYRKTALDSMLSLTTILFRSSGSLLIKISTTEIW